MFFPFTVQQTAVIKKITNEVSFIQNSYSYESSDELMINPFSQNFVFAFLSSRFNEIKNQQILLFIKELKKD